MIDLEHFPIETEVKLRLPDAITGKALLELQRFEVVRPRVFEANTLWDTAEGTLRAQDIALRLREAGGEVVLTHKGPASGGKHKSREENEVLVSNAEVCAKILRAIGYRPAFRYEKFRTEFARPGEPGHALLDETPIGCFLELEGPPQWIDQTACELGFSQGDYLTDSYSRLYVAHCMNLNRVPSNMVFSAT